MINIIITDVVGGCQKPVVGVEINACCSVCARVEIAAEYDLLLTKFSYKQYVNYMTFINSYRNSHKT